MVCINMEMPKSCRECRFKELLFMSGYHCALNGEYISDSVLGKNVTRDKNCLLEAVNKS